MVKDLRKSEEIKKGRNLKVKSARLIIESGLKKVGLKNSDIVLVHADATPAMYLGDYEWWDDACELIKSCFLKVLGGYGTLIVPTINWDFCNGKPYSHSTTISKCGMFSNNILFDPRSIRSFHPIYSFAGIGPALGELFTNISKSSFGKGSVFEKLHKINAKILFFNLNFGLCTFVHYVEQKKGVSYRYLKEFTGLVEKNGKKYNDTFDFYVRYLDKKTTLDNQGFLYVTRLGEYMLSKGKINKTILKNKYPIYLTDCNKVLSEVMSKFDVDPYYAVDCS